MAYKNNHNPLTVLEAITLAKMSSVNAFTHQRSSKIHYEASMAQVHSVTPLPIVNPLSHENDNNSLLLSFSWERGFSMGSGLI